jgi:hypothetical protein
MQMAHFLNYEVTTMENLYMRAPSNNLSRLPALESSSSKSAVEEPSTNAPEYSRTVEFSRPHKKRHNWSSKIMIHMDPHVG